MLKRGINRTCYSNVFWYFLRAPLLENIQLHLPLYNHQVRIFIENQNFSNLIVITTNFYVLVFAKLNKCLVTNHPINYHNIYKPFFKSLHQSNRICVCLCVPKNIFSCWTDIVLFYSVAFQGPEKVYILFYY